MEEAILSANFAHRKTKTAFHYHDSHEIIFVTSGSALIELNHCSYTAKRGNLVIFSRFEQHAVTSRSEDYQRYVVQIAPSVPMKDKDSYRIFSVLFNRPDKFENVLDFSDRFYELESIFKRLVQEKSGREILKENMLNLLLQELMIQIFRGFPKNFEHPNPDMLEIVRQIQMRFETEYEKNFTLENLSSEFGWSVSYLSHRFREITGKSVMGYLTDCRMAAAKRYLSETDLNIGKIVELCGFTDDSNFSRLFKKLTDNTPSEFRQRLKV